MDLSRLHFPTLLFVVTVLFGFWLSRLGKPYNQVLFNIHKLIALGAVVIGVMRFMRSLQSPSGVILGVLVLAAVCVVALFVTGAMMSAGKFEFTLMHTGHQAAAAGLVVSSGVFLAAIGAWL